MNLQWKLHNLSTENKSQYLGPKYNPRKENYITSLPSYILRRK